MLATGALLAHAGAHAVDVLALVFRDHGCAGLEPTEQSLGARDVVVVAGRDQEVDRPALAIDARVDFRREPAPSRQCVPVAHEGAEDGP